MDIFFYFIIYMKKYFLVYDDNTHTPHLLKLIDSVKKYSDFEIIIFQKKDMDIDFVNKNKEILESHRGGGYWLWKPYIINKILDQIMEGDYLFYMDSKYYFTEDFTDLYTKFMENNDILVWGNKPNESTNEIKNFCKLDVILKYNITRMAFIENRNEFWAGALLIKKTSFIQKMMNEWLSMCCNYEDISDSPSIKQKPCFIDHRHDQSLLSIVLHKNNIPMNYFEKIYLQNVRNPY